MSDAVTAALAVLGVIGQVALAAFLLVGLLRLAGVHGPWRVLRETLDGSELWLAFAVALLATAGSLFFSEIEHFVPCKLCWFQRVCMYPLLVLALPALAGDRRAARYLLPLPIVGLGVAVWHLLVERVLVAEAQSCVVSAPGGCRTRWIEEFGYMTIPMLAATGFALIAFFLGLAAFRRAEPLWR